MDERLRELEREGASEKLLRYKKRTGEYTEFVLNEFITHIKTSPCLNFESAFEKGDLPSLYDLARMRKFFYDHGQIETLQTARLLHDGRIPGTNFSRRGNPIRPRTYMWGSTGSGDVGEGHPLWREGAITILIGELDRVEDGVPRFSHTQVRELYLTGNDYPIVGFINVGGAHLPNIVSGAEASSYGAVSGGLDMAEGHTRSPLCLVRGNFWTVPATDHCAALSKTTIDNLLRLEDG